jgi:hypothetical protein
MENNILNNLKKAVDMHGQPIVLFGAALLGEVALKTIERAGIRPSCFCDNSPLKQDNLFWGYEIISPVKLKRDYVNPYVIVCSIRYGGICEQLYSMNILPHNAAEIFDCVGYNYVYSEPSDSVKAEIDRYIDIIAATRSSDRIYIENIDLAITEKCSLKCKHCMNLSTYYLKPKDVDTTILLQSLKRLADCVDGILVVNVHGGEPFMNMNMHTVIDFLINNPKVMKIMVITNGTLVPAGKNLTSLKNEKVCVVIDDYKELSQKITDLRETLIRERINHKLIQMDQWLDYGGFECRNRNRQELLITFSKCRKCLTVLHGKLFVCGRSAHGINLGIFGDDKFDYIDLIHNNMIDIELRKEIYKLSNRAENISACNYCNAFNLECATMIKAAVQKH